ncbi:putative protein kinase RLK-Pelle-CrRLK1L-1 family [Helianthus annuus]|nr:putative protein kinase RLK-Pelle-CrRLK1L-1 family [Helianthus annuus]
MDNLKVPLSEIIKATDNFSEKYFKGLGGYGTVYVAELPCFDGIGPVAIKRTNKRRDKETEIRFMAEVDMLIKAKHDNIVSLLGFCDEADEMILICEYASNGSLDKYLGNGSTTSFTWSRRLNICLNIAQGLHHLHNGLPGENTIIHRDIKSDNILLDDKWVAKIADFGLSKLHKGDKKHRTFATNKRVGTMFYADPEYMKRGGKLKKKSDIYSFGVVLFEILCGRLAYDKDFIGMGGLPAIARNCYKDGNLKLLVDPKIKEARENVFTLNGGVNQVSIDKFSKVAYKCLAQSQDDRPTIEYVIKKLKKALYYQENYKDSLHISLDDMKSATKNFSKIIGEGRHWKQYKGEIKHGNKPSTIVAKRWDRNSPEGRYQFFTELKILYENKHENIISLVGYCNEKGEHIIVYQNAPNGSLDKHLINASLTWIRRLKICIDVAKGLEFLHTSVSMMHRDIKSSSILLDGDWKAKISNFELSTPLSDTKPIEHVTDDNAYRSLSYVSKNDQEQGYLTRESDIYSLGVVLKEVLWGRLTDPTDRGSHHVVHNGQEILDGLVLLEGMEEQIDRKSLDTFEDIAGLCLAYRKYRPRVTEVITKLEKALNLQISSMAKMYESPEMKKDLDDVFSKGILLKDDKMISSMTKMYESAEMKKDLDDIFSKGILLKDNKVWLSLGSNGERNELISARNFSYKNCSSLKWRSSQDSRFPRVAEIIDVSNLKIQIKIKTQFLPPSGNQKVHLIFRFWGPRKSQAKRMYVNLKYKMGNETLHTYFATWREDGWMMIELFRSLNHKEDTHFEVQLESMSRGYCGNSSIYIEGIEFQAVENVSHEDSKRLKEVPNVLIENSNMDKEEKEEMMLSAKKVVRTNSYSMGRYLGREKLGEHMYGARMYKSHQIHQDSIKFSGAIEFKRHQLFRIRYKIQRQILSADTKNACYLVFKLSEKCRGLHAPVLVRDFSHTKKREILYFRSPHPTSLHDGDWIPKKRNDGWMEVIIWIFKSSNEIKHDHLFVDLKLTTYEGTMSGLIVRGIEFRPI